MDPDFYKEDETCKTILEWTPPINDDTSHAFRYCRLAWKT